MLCPSTIWHILPRRHFFQYFELAFFYFPFQIRLSIILIFKSLIVTAYYFRLFYLYLWPLGKQKDKVESFPFAFPLSLYQEDPVHKNLEICSHHISLTDPNASCPRSLLKTTPPPPGCPWVPGGPEVTPEPSFRGLVLDHQVWKQPEAKNLSKTAKFDQKQQFLSVF